MIDSYRNRSSSGMLRCITMFMFFVCFALIFLFVFCLFYSSSFSSANDFCTSESFKGLAF